MINENNPYEVIAFEQQKVRDLNAQVEAEERKYRSLAETLREDQYKLRTLQEDFERLKVGLSKPRYKHVVGDERPASLSIQNEVPIFSNGQLVNEFPWGAGKFWKERNDLIGTLIPNGADVLDLGGGFCRLAEYVTGRYQSLDLKAWTNVTREADFNNGQFPDVGYFDKIVCQGLLEYIQDPRIFLHSIRKYGDSLLLTYQRGTAHSEARNNLTFEELEGHLTAAGWQVVNHCQIDSPSQRLYVCKRLAIASEMKTYWWGEGQTKNWGDIFTRFLFEQRYHKFMVLTDPPHADYFGCGSVLDHLPEGYSGHVLGSGIQYSSTIVDLTKAKNPIIIRGELTQLRCKFNTMNFVLGDLGLLANQWAPHNPTKRFNIGIIPHYADKKYGEVSFWGSRDGFTVIDIEAGVQAVINRVSECAAIISSSLHGLVLADALGIPSRWVVLSPNVGGCGFKFYDYYSAYGEYPEPLYSIQAAVSSSIAESADRLGERNVEGVRNSITEALAQIIK